MDKDLILVRQLGCQWIGIENRAPSCGSKDLVDGTCYCAEHWVLMRQKGTALAKRKKDVNRANAIWDWESDFNAVLTELDADGLL